MIKNFNLPKEKELTIEEFENELIKNGLPSLTLKEKMYILIDIDTNIDDLWIEISKTESLVIDIERTENDTIIIHDYRIDIKL